MSDQYDNKILELAEESRADFIVTGNTNDFTFTHYKSSRVLSPKEYWDLNNGIVSRLRRGTR